MNSPLVSVVVVAYQHVSYITKCLDSILAQQTDFDYEILLGEDESSDGTREICLAYAKKHPKKIKLFLRSRKDVVYLNGNPIGRFNFLSTLKEASGKYIAICEGDDYWTDKSKLQRQVDCLERNTDLVACFHDATRVNENDELIAENHYTTDKLRFTEHDCISFLTSSYATCALLFRRSAISYEWDNPLIEQITDEYLELVLAKYGDIERLPYNMAAYRIHSAGRWTSLTLINRLKEKFNRIALIQSIPYYKNKYDLLLQMRAIRLRDVILRNYKKESELIVEKEGDTAENEELVKQLLQLKKEPKRLVDTVLLDQFKLSNARHKAFTQLSAESKLLINRLEYETAKLGAQKRRLERKNQELQKQLERCAEAHILELELIKINYNSQKTKLDLTHKKVINMEKRFLTAKSRADDLAIQNDRLADKRSKLRALLEKKTEDLIKNKGQVLSTNQEIASLKEDLSKLNQSNEAKTKKVLGLQSRLTSAVTNLEHEKNHILEIKQSYSWKIGYALTKLPHLLFGKRLNFKHKTKNHNDKKS